MPPNYKFPLRDGAASEFTPRAAAGKIASAVVNFSQRPSAMMSRGIPSLDVCRRSNTVRVAEKEAPLLFVSG